MPWILATNKLPGEGVKCAARQKGMYLQLSIPEKGIIKVGRLRMHSIEILEEWFPGIEWLDESEADQEVLWDKVFEELDCSLGWDSQTGPYIPNKTQEKLRRLYTLIRK